MFTQSPAKVDSNPLRRQLVRKGYTVRGAARALGVLPSRMVVLLDAHDKESNWAARIRALPPAKKSTDRADKKSPGADTSATRA